MSFVGISDRNMQQPSASRDRNESTTLVKILPACASALGYDKTKETHLSLLAVSYPTTRKPCLRHPIIPRSSPMPDPSSGLR